jgi:hypothetical protein
MPLPKRYRCPVKCSPQEVFLQAQMPGETVFSKSFPRYPQDRPRGGAGHPLPLWLEESSRLGSGGIFGRGTGGESGLVATSLFRVNARPSKPIAIKIAPPIISQCGNSIDESKPIYFPFHLEPTACRPHADTLQRNNLRTKSPDLLKYVVPFRPRRQLCERSLAASQPCLLVLAVSSPSFPLRLQPDLIGRAVFDLKRLNDTLRT